MVDEWNAVRGGNTMGSVKEDGNTKVVHDLACNTISAVREETATVEKRRELFENLFQESNYHNYLPGMYIALKRLAHMEISAGRVLSIENLCKSFTLYHQAERTVRKFSQASDILSKSEQFVRSEKQHILTLLNDLQIQRRVPYRTERNVVFVVPWNELEKGIVGNVLFNVGRCRVCREKIVLVVKDSNDFKYYCIPCFMSYYQLQWISRDVCEDDENVAAVLRKNKTAVLPKFLLSYRDVHRKCPKELLGDELGFPSSSVPLKTKQKKKSKNKTIKSLRDSNPRRKTHQHASDRTQNTSSCSTSIPDEEFPPLMTASERVDSAVDAQSGSTAEEGKSEVLTTWDEPIVESDLGLEDENEIPPESINGNDSGNINEFSAIQEDEVNETAVLE